MVLDGVRVRLPRGHRRRSSPSTTPAATTPGSRFWALQRAPAGSRGSQADRRPDRVRRPGARHAAPAGHRHHPARHLRAALGVRHPRRERDAWDLRYREDPARRLLGAGQRVGPLQPLPQQARRAASAGGCPTSDPNSSERLTDYRRAVRVVDRHRLQPRARSGTAAPGSSCTSTARGATAGCVSAPRGSSSRLMGGLDPDRAPGDRDRALSGAERAAEKPRSRSTSRAARSSSATSHKVLYPRTGTTKGEVLNYYAQIAPVLLPHLADRAVTRIRWPHGVRGHRASSRRTPRPARRRGCARRRCRPPARAAAVRAGRRHPRLPDRRRPRHADLAGQPGRARAARPPVDGRPQRRSRATPTGWSSTSTRASRPGCTSAARWRCWCATRSPSATWTPSRSPAAARACTSTPTCRAGCRRDESTALAKEVAEELQERAPEAGHRDDDQGPAVGQGVPRLVAERRLEDHDLAVLPARPRAALRSPPRVTWDEVEAGAEDPLGLEQFRFEEVLERVAEHGDLFAAELAWPSERVVR